MTELQHIDLGSCRVMVTVHEGVLARLSRQDDLLSALQEGVPPLHNNTLAFLNLDNFEVSVRCFCDRHGDKGSIQGRNEVIKG